MNSIAETDDARERREDAMYARLDAICHGQPEPPVVAGAAGQMARYPFLTARQIIDTTEGVLYTNREQWAADVESALDAANDARRIVHNLKPEPQVKETLAMPTADRLNGTAHDTPSITTTTRDLDTALLACQRELRSIGRDGYNAHSDYGYTSADHWIAASRDVLHKHDVMARRERWTVTPWGDRAIIAATFTVTHVPSGQRLALDTSLAVEDRKGTPIDKAILAGLTSLWAYTLRDLLLVPRCDGNELDAINDADHQPAGENTTATACRAALIGRGVSADDAEGIIEWFRASTGGTPNRETRRKFRADIDAGSFDRWTPPVPVGS